MVSIADLEALGVRELAYRYDLGDCWIHEIHRGENPAARRGHPARVPGRRGTTPARTADWEEDDDGNLVPVAEPEPGHVYDLARINRALARVIAEPDETATWRDDGAVRGTRRRTTTSGNEQDPRSHPLPATAEPGA